MKELEVQPSSVKAILDLSDDEIMFMLDQLVKFIDEVTEEPSE